MSRWIRALAVVASAIALASCRGPALPAATPGAGASPTGAAPASAPALTAGRATAGLAAGDVVLLHDADHYSSSGSWRNTVAALPSILEAVAALGLPFVPVTQEM